MRIGSVVLHVADLNRASWFWSQALGYSVARGESENSSPVLSPGTGTGTGPALVLDLDDRTHLDLHTDSPQESAAEVERLLVLGARRVPWEYPEGANFVVLADPDENLFCVVDVSAR